MIIKRVGVLSVAKIMGALYAMLGLIIGLCFGLFVMLGLGAAMIGNQSHDAAVGAGVAGMGMGMGLAMIVLFPIFYGVIGLIGGLITGALYNLTAGFMGGIEIDVE